MLRAGGILFGINGFKTIKASLQTSQEKNQKKRLI